LYLNRLNILNQFKTEFEPRRPELCWPGPPVGAPPLTPGPIAAQPHLSATPCRVARGLPPSPVRQPASAVSACYCLRLRRSEPFQPCGLAANPVPPPFTVSPSAAWHARIDPPPPFPSLLYPTRPPIWRRHRHLTPLRLVPEPELELPLLPHCLRNHLTGSHRRRLQLLSGSCPSATASAASR
jgi:hypothetical protein